MDDCLQTYDFQLHVNVFVLMVAFLIVIFLTCHAYIVRTSGLQQQSSNWYQ
jgi:hypothetical protein